MMMNGQMISGIKAAEEMLAREQKKREMSDAQKMVDSLPDDHPLVVEFNRNVAMVGDLNGLPAGHPLFKALADAKKRHDEKIETDNAQEGAKGSRLKKKDDHRKIAAQKSADEEMERQVKKMAGKTLNDQIDRTTAQIGSLYESMKELLPTLENDPYCKVKMRKLERILYASKRGIDECKISTTRI